MTTSRRDPAGELGAALGYRQGATGTWLGHCVECGERDATVAITGYACRSCGRTISLDALAVYVAIGDAWPTDPAVPGVATPDPLPVAELPDGLRAWVESVAASCQVPAELPASLVLAVVSAAVAGRVVVEVDGAWPEEWVTVYTVTILPPGSRKSGAYAHIVRPLAEWEVEASRETGPARQAALDVVEVETRRLAAKRAAAAKGAGTLAEVEAARLALTAAERAVPPAARLLVQDATSEAMVRVMADSGGRAALLAPEGDPLRIADGRYSGAGDARLGPLKMAWSGEPIRVDRIGREGEWIRRPALTVALTMQPGVLATLRHGASMRAEGVLGRILWAEPPHGLGTRRTGSDVPALDDAAQCRYASIVSALLRLEPASTDKDGTGVPHRLELTDDARDTLYAWAAEVERGLADGEVYASIRDAAAKAVGQAVRVAALLTLAQRAEVGEELVDKPVPAWAVESAVRLVRAYMTHALAVLAPTDGYTAVLAYVLRRAVELPAGSSLRDLHRACEGRAAIESADDLRELVDELAKRGCVRLREVERSGPGRRPSPTVEVHPALLSARANTDKIDRIGNNVDSVGSSRDALPLSDDDPLAVMQESRT